MQRSVTVTRRYRSTLTLPSHTSGGERLTGRGLLLYVCVRVCDGATVISFIAVSFLRCGSTQELTPAPGVKISSVGNFMNCREN